MNKTLKLIEKHLKFIREQDENGLPPDDDGSGQQDPNITQNPQPNPEDEMPMSSAGEDTLISNLVDAALFSPSPEDAKTLQDLQSAMKMKRYKNAREEILPIVLGIIQPSTGGSDIRNSLNQLD